MTYILQNIGLIWAKSCAIYQVGAYDVCVKSFGIEIILGNNAERCEPGPFPRTDAQHFSWSG